MYGGPYNADFLGDGESADAERRVGGKDRRRDLPKAAIFVVYTPPPWFRESRL